MEMKDRVEGFLKVTRERVIDAETSEIMWNMNDLYNELRELIGESDQDLLDSLTAQWDKFWHERKIQKWDEKFLKVISGDDERSQLMVERRANQTPQRVRQGAPITYPTIAGTTNMTLSTTNNASTGATWVTNNTIASNIDKDLALIKAELKKFKEGR